MQADFLPGEADAGRAKHVSGSPRALSRSGVSPRRCHLRVSERLAYVRFYPIIPAELLKSLP